MSVVQAKVIWLFISLLLFLIQPVGILERLQFTSRYIFTTCLRGFVYFQNSTSGFLFQDEGGLEPVKEQAWLLHCKPETPCQGLNPQSDFSFIRGAFFHISIFCESYSFIM